MDLSMIGKSCLPRHRITQLEVARAPDDTLTRPNYDAFTLSKLSVKDNDAMYEVMNLVHQCARRGGSEILQILTDVLQYRLLGGAPGDKAHSLVDKFMTCVHSPSPSHRTRSADPLYANNPVEPSNKQKSREANRGDLAALSTGYRTRQKLAAKVKMCRATLTGASERVDVDCITLEKAKNLKLVDTEHKVLYVSPFTASQFHEQELILKRAGMCLILSFFIVRRVQGVFCPHL